MRYLLAFAGVRRRRGPRCATRPSAGTPACSSSAARCAPAATRSRRSSLRRSCARHSASAKQILDELITDAVFACASRRIARTLAPRVPVYQYELTHPLDDPRPHGLGATHSVELFFVFGNADLGIGLSEAEQPLSYLIQDAWGRFARTGDPSGAELPWPRYSAATDTLAVLDLRLSLAAHVKRDICDRWDTLVR